MKFCIILFGCALIVSGYPIENDVDSDVQKSSVESGNITILQIVQNLISQAGKQGPGALRKLQTDPTFQWLLKELIMSGNKIPGPFPESLSLDSDLTLMRIVQHKIAEAAKQGKEALKELLSDPEFQKLLKEATASNKNPGPFPESLSLDSDLTLMRIVRHKIAEAAKQGKEALKELLSDPEFQKLLKEATAGNKNPGPFPESLSLDSDLTLMRIVQHKIAEAAKQGKEALKELLNDPEFQKLLKEATAGNKNPGPFPESLSLDSDMTLMKIVQHKIAEAAKQGKEAVQKLLNDPAFQKLLKETTANNKNPGPFPESFVQENQAGKPLTTGIDIILLRDIRRTFNAIVPTGKVGLLKLLNSNTLESSVSHLSPRTHDWLSDFFQRVLLKLNNTNFDDLMKYIDSQIGGKIIELIVFESGMH